MKNIIWIAITGVLILAIAWLCNFVFKYTFGDALATVLCCGSIIALAGGIGYILIFFLEKKETYNIFIAALMPWMPVFALWLIISCFAPMLGFGLLALFPFLLIGSSVGGVLAHRKRLKQFAQNAG